jgi:hypothetical protein
MSESRPLALYCVDELNFPRRRFSGLKHPIGTLSALGFQKERV